VAVFGKIATDSFEQIARSLAPRQAMQIRPFLKETKETGIRSLFSCCLPWLMGLALAMPFAFARSAEVLPAASNVMHRVIERSQLVAKAEQTNHYAYDKRSITEELDEKGRATKTTEKHYKVILVNGLPFPRLVRIQGRELTAKELEKENQRETAFRERVTRIDFKKKAKRREALATPDLVNRFTFNVTKREMIEGRPTLTVTFAPKPGAPEKSIEDKIYKHVFGTIWVDEEEAEITKLDASVRGPVPLGWFGAVGSLNKFHAIFERSRMPDGMWVNRRSQFSVAARQLWKALRFRTEEESSRFRREGH
jgi:hypothetical protein